MVHDPYRYSLPPPPAGGGYSDSEYPYLRYEDGRFCPLIKDDFKSKRQGICGIWGADLYAESHDCIHWEFADDPAVYTRRIVWSNGAVTNQTNCERPWLLPDGKGPPSHLFLATGDGVPHRTGFQERRIW